MPCRSSLASISLRPRDSRDFSRRPSGTKGGVAGLLGFGAAHFALAGDDEHEGQAVAMRALQEGE